MTYPTSGGSPDPYQPAQPYGQQPYDPNAPYPADAAPSSGQPGYGPPAPFGQSPAGQGQQPAPFGQPPPEYGQQPAPFGQQPTGYGQQPAGYEQPTAYGEQPTSPYGGLPSPYGQPPYGSPPPYGQGPYAPVATTNTMAILALVFAFVFAPAAIVMGHVARRQIRQTGEQGEGLATAGLWLGYIFTAIGALACIGYILIVVVAIGSAANSSGTF